MKSVDIEKYRRFLDVVAQAKATKLGQTAYYELDTIDNKTASLLTHVSIMMAVLAIVYSSLAAAPITRSAILVELLAYLVVTFGCLRSVFMKGPSAEDSDVERAIDRRIQVARERYSAYAFSWFLTMIATIAFVVTVFVHLVVETAHL